MRSAIGALKKDRWIAQCITQQIGKKHQHEQA